VYNPALPDAAATGERRGRHYVNCMKVLVIKSGKPDSYHVVRSMGRQGHDVHLIARRCCRRHRSQYAVAVEAACRQSLAS
jgi:hypothetical protein